MPAAEALAGAELHGDQKGRNLTETFARRLALRALPRRPSADPDRRRFGLRWRKRRERNEDDARAQLKQWQRLGACCAQESLRDTRQRRWRKHTGYGGRISQPHPLRLNAADLGVLFA
eukprot:3918833-Pleurochrysis_carterae.AAC.1